MIWYSFLHLFGTIDMTSALAHVVSAANTSATLLSHTKWH
jgi:hypothetical protein